MSACPNDCGLPYLDGPGGRGHEPEDEERCLAILAERARQERDGD